MEKYKEYILRQSNVKKLVIWGFGSYGKAVYDMFTEANVKVSCFCDGNYDKIGMDYRGCECISCDDVCASSNEYFVLIANQFATQIVPILTDNKFTNQDYNIVPSPYKIMFDEYYCNISPSLVDEKLDYVYSLLADEESKRVFNKLKECWKENSLQHDELLDIFNDNQYFCKDIIKIDSNTVFADIGAYLGDSLNDFLRNTNNNNFKKAICYELNEEIYQKLCNYVGTFDLKLQSKIEIINKGISDTSATIRYISTEGSSHIGVDGEKEGYLVSLDSYFDSERINLIKMDIEGSEMAALKGATETIKKNKPDLAICVYHKPDDIWEIPTYIKSLVPDYKIYLRHHSKTLIETVCYATIK